MTAQPLPTRHVYADEKSYINRKSQIVAAAELMNADCQREPDVIPHNTMRFDVSLGHVYAMLDEGMVTKDQIVLAIRKAIVKAVDDTLGKGLDGVPIPGGADIIIEPDSVMLHRETIAFDLS